MPEKYKLDVPVDLSEKTTDKLELAKKILHLITGVTTLLTICVVAPLIATEAKYEGAGAPGPNYTLFVAIISIAVPFALVYFPWMYEKHNKFRRGGKFLMKSRTNIIFCGFNSFLWATAGIAITVHSNNAATCTINADLQKAYGDSYTGAWATACNLAKVTSGFAWITCLLWLSTLLIVGISFWGERSIVQQRLNEHRISKQNKMEEMRKQQEDEESHYQASGRVYEEEGSPFADQYQQHSPYQQQQHSPYQQQQHSPYQQPEHSPYQSPFADPVNTNSASPQHPNVFDSNTPGQYATPGFSPMPQPYHNY